MRFTVLLGAMATLMTACSATLEKGDPIPSTPLMGWSDLTERALPSPTATYAYGEHPAQIADLWLPDGAEKHPVVLMVHGGCWQKEIADRTLMNYAAEDLRQRGMAVWNIEYRGVDEDGGGYPGTYLDVSLAADKLLEAGPALGLNTDQIVAFGHSAGGHLAAWLAGQPNLPDDSRVSTGKRVPLNAVIISGGLADLEASAPVTLESCLPAIMDGLTGQADANRPHVFSDTSPAELLPVDAVLVSVNGDSDRIAPPILGEAFTEKVQAAGGDARYVEIAETGHVELISPGTDAFDAQAGLLQEYFGR